MGDLAGMSLPWAFDRSTEKIDQTETAPGASETVDIEPTETAETDKTVERTVPERIQSANSIEIDDPSKQLQGEPVYRILSIEELTSGMSRQSERLPPLDKGDRIKPVGVKYDVLDASNIRLWKKKIEGLLRLQKCWKVVENTRKMRIDGKTELLHQAMQDEDYIDHNLLAVTYLTAYISEEDANAVKNLEISGDIWIYLMEKYEAVNPRRKVNLLMRLFTWKMDPKMKIREAIQDLEKLHEEVKDVWEKEYLDQDALMVLFLCGLPPEYEAYADGLRSIGDTKRAVILSRLEEKEISTRAERRAEVISKSANRAEQRRCFNCGKKGHFARDCTAPEKNREQSNSREDSQGWSHRRDHGKARAYGNGRDKSRRGHTGRQRGGARTANEETDTASFCPFPFEHLQQLIYLQMERFYENPHDFDV